MNRNKYIQAAVVVGASMALGFGITKIVGPNSSSTAEAAAVDYTNVQDSPEVKRGIASMFSAKPVQKVNLVQIPNPLDANDISLFSFSAPEDSMVDSLTATTNLLISSGQLELSSNFTDDFINTSSMTEGDFMSVNINYTFPIDGMITWDNVVPNNPHHKWADHPQYIAMRAGSHAVLTYTYDRGTQDWTAAIAVQQ